MSMSKLPHGSGLNIVPFIDIMLVLLCIVLSISSFIAQGKIEVKLPASSSQVKPQDKVSLMLEVNSKGEIYLDGKQQDLVSLKEGLQKLNKEDHVELRIDESSEFKNFINIIDILKEIQHENFSIATKRT